MAFVTRIFLLGIACTMTITACGHKGKLKSPSQVEKAEQKKKK